MSHFAKVLDEKVVDVIVADQEVIDTFDDHDNWIQTSYNTFGNTHKTGGVPLRGNYASIGCTYDSVNDVFYSPQPYLSWVLNKNTWLWEHPVPRPDDETPYLWDEITSSWIDATHQ